MAFCTNCGTELTSECVFCSECGSRIEALPFEESPPESSPNFSGTKICPYCGSQMPEDIFYCLSCGQPFNRPMDNFATVTRRIQMQNGVWKNKWVSLFLCLFLGWLGIHRFYEGKAFTGLLYFCTLGVFGLGWIIDIVRIGSKPNPYRVK